MSLPLALSLSSETVTFGVALAAAGFSSSFVAGVLGAGGGLIAIPLLQAVLMRLGLDSTTAMELTVGTMSLGMVMMSFLSSLRESRLGTIDWEPMKHWIIPVTLGVLSTHLLGLAQSGEVMKITFALLVVVIAGYMMFGREEWKLYDKIPLGPVWWAMGLAFGFVCSLVGIGGSIVAIPLMVACGVSIHKAITSSVVLGMMVGIPSVLFYLQAPTIKLAGTVGYVNFWIAGLLMITGLLGRPVGLWVQRRIPAHHLRHAFSAVLVVAATRLCWESLAG